MRSSRRTRRATALVITVGMLAVLAVIGFGFAVLMRLQYDTARYFGASSEIDLLSHAIVSYAVRDIRYGWSNARPPEAPVNALMHSYQVGAIAEPTDSPTSPWFIDAETASSLYDDPDDPSVGRYCYLKNNSYAMVHDALGDRVAVSYAKVLDSASKININDKNDNLTAILNTLLSADCLDINDAVDLNGSGNAVGTLTGAAIITRRNALTDQKFTTLSQLNEKDSSGNPRITGMSDRRFDVLKHYLTIYSWPHEPESVHNFVPGIVYPDSSGKLHYDDNSDTGACRSRININTAPREVLVAILANVKLRGSTELGVSKAQDIADWILRKRDPEDTVHWSSGNFSASWQSWLTNNDYKTYIRTRYVSAWRAYQLGHFDTWSEVIDFFYSLTDGASSTPGNNPFDHVTGLDTDDAEAIIAAVCPNSFASTLPHNTRHLSYARLGRSSWGNGEAIRVIDPDFRLRDKNTATDTIPESTGKNDLATDGYTPEFCFSAMGRFEIFSRTFAFVKAAAGKVTSTSDYKLTDDTKAWGTAPPQWRGYSVLIYDGDGKGQLRAIVNNTVNTLTVAKWSSDLETSSTSADQSRYYIVGPGHLLDATGTVSSSTPHIVTDSGMDWEDGQWNGYRVVVYKSSVTSVPGPGGKNIQVESINEDTIEERIIVGTRDDQLILSPELDRCSGSVSYMILGSYGNVAHEAALKAYDVIHHTSQKDFAPDDATPAGCTNVSIGPNPLRAGVSSAEIDGWVAVTTRDTDQTVVPLAGGTLALAQNFKTGLGTRSVGGATTATVGNVYDNGNVTPDGLHLAAGSGRTAGFSTAPALITPNKVGNGETPDGGFVSFWFRPDANCMGSSTPTRTLIRIKGETDADDLRLLMDRTTLKLVVRVGDQQPYGTNLPGKDAGGNATNQDVFCRTGPRNGPSIDVSVRDVAKGVNAPWKPGEWHYIAFAWYECYSQGALNDDSDMNTPSEYDGPVGNPDYTRLDANQVLAAMRLWLDGVPVGNTQTVDAFNLVPDAIGAHLYVGQSGSEPAGTVDGIVAYTHTNRALSFSLNHLKPNTMFRYWGGAYPNANYATYTSPSITLPSNIAGKQVCLGTVALNYTPPIIAPRKDWHYGSKYYPVYVTTTMGATTTTAIPNPSYGQSWFYQSVLGGGGALRNGTATVHGTGSTIKYTVKLTAYNGYTGANPSPGYFEPPYWQTPVLEDITVTYLSPVAFFHWQ